MNKMPVAAVAMIIAFSGTATSFAAKPEKEMKKAEKTLMKEQHKADKQLGKEEDKLTGLDKQREKKAEQQQKELDRGSDQGQTQRDEVRKKWWRFWE